MVLSIAPPPVQSHMTKGRIVKYQKTENRAVNSLEEKCHYEVNLRQLLWY